MEKPMELTTYLNENIKKLIADVAKSCWNNPKAASFLLGCGKHLRRGAKRRTENEKNGVHVPAFLIASIADTCNLTCSGCYARANGLCGSTESKGKLTPTQWSNLFEQSRDLGISFILLAGGEPLMEPAIIKEAAKMKEILFPIFTNGTMIDDAYLQLFYEHRHLIPVLSLEGEAVRTEARRGEGVYAQILQTMDQLQKRGLLFGTSITVSKDNLEEVTSKSFLDELSRRGCRLVFYVEYVPLEAGTEDEAFAEAERARMDEAIEQLRASYRDLTIIAFPGDEEELGGCLAAGRGFFHINPYGGAEPCPFSPYSRENLKDHTLVEVLQSPFFAEVRRIEAAVGGQHRGGCALFEQREAVQQLL